MKKIAILLGISEYNSRNELPACKNDVMLMYDLLKLTGEYEEILSLYQNQSSSKIKQQIVSFLKRFEKESVEQLFFYYTGHGDFDGKEFYYLLSDYEKSKHKQTTIENSELDRWIKLIKPQLTVKVVDACHAGIQYIKDSETFKKYLTLTTTPKSFNLCYFMFSSQRYEYSYQNDQLSFFTQSFAESVADFSGSEMRFKDIIDYISDYFQAIPAQTPLFVTQATNTEIFTKIDHNLRDDLKKSLQKFLYISEASESEKQESTEELSLVELVRKDAVRYCTEEEVAERLNIIKEKLTEIELDDETRELYSLIVDPLTDLNSKVPQTDEIGKWLSKSENEYFAEPTYRVEKYEEEVPISRGFYNYNLGVWGTAVTNYPFSTKTVIREKKVIDGYKVTFNTEYPAYRITAKPKYQNLNWYDCHIAYILSKTEVCFFYLISKLKEINWRERKRTSSAQWKMLPCELKNKEMLANTVDSIIKEFIDEIITSLKSKYFPTEEAETSSKKSQQITPPDRYSAGASVCQEELRE